MIDYYFAYDILDVDLMLNINACLGNASMIKAGLPFSREVKQIMGGRAGQGYVSRYLNPDPCCAAISPHPYQTEW